MAEFKLVGYTDQGRSTVDFIKANTEAEAIQKWKKFSNWELVACYDVTVDPSRMNLFPNDPGCTDSRP